MASGTPTSSIPIIDSHIHLYPEAEVDSLAWCDPASPLAGRRSLAEYHAATGSPIQLRGFVFLETDRKNDSSRDWTAPFQEVAWLRRIAVGEPRDGEGHVPEDARLCMGIVPWAPVALGPERLKKYIAQVEETAGPKAWPLVKGFRYLVQDKPNGTMLKDEFIAGLKLLGKKGFVFDLGVDQHRRGKVQLEEAVEMINRAHEGVKEEDKVVFVLNHLCKPDLTIINHAVDPSFIAWRTAMFTLSRSAYTYMKLSGVFSEMTDALRARPADDIFQALHPWLAVILAAFGPSRIMFGSDWPVCTVGVDGVGEGPGAWQKWRRVVERMCDLASLSVDDQAMLWGGTARKAYKLVD